MSDGGPPAAAPDGVAELLDALPMAITRWNRDLRCDFVNAAAMAVTGRPAAEWLGCSVEEVSDGTDQAALRAAAIRSVLDSGNPLQLDEQRGGPVTRQAVRATIAPQRGPDGAVEHVIVAVVDITDLAASHREVVEREELLNVVLERTTDTIVRFDPELRYDFVNDRAAAVAGVERSAWIGRTQADMGYAPDDVAEREARLTHVFTTGVPATYLDEFDVVDGHRWFESQLFPQVGPDGRVAHVIVVSRDVTDRVLAERALILAAERDPLTGLANRTALVQHLEDALEAGARTAGATAVLLVDLDHFKYVNDSLGHALGDELLCRAAERLVGCVRNGDVVARHGGDEFVVVLAHPHQASDAVHLAQRIVEAFRLPLVTGTTELSTTASVGISWTTGDGQPTSAHDLLRQADTAMYVAKDGGRDGVAVFDEALQAVVDERLRIENELRGALGRNELAVWYQPEIDLVTGEVRAVEALLRWCLPTGEVRAAGQFIDVASDTGLIVEIGRWVIDQACQAAADWFAEGLVVRVNLAPRQLASPDLLATFDRAIARTGADPRRLCAEITETALLHDTVAVRDNLAGLAERGIAVAIDDFGTGYASLTYLRRYEVDVIKVDRSFVASITSCDRDRRLTAAVVALAHQLGMDVTAEGVEHEDQEAVVRSLGCSGAQGWLYGAAMPPAEVDEIIAARRAR